MLEHKGWWFPDEDTHFQSTVNQFPDTWYQQETLDKAYRYVKQFNCVVDIGANIGLHSVRFASKFKSVFSFEPVSTNFECLEKNIKTFTNTKCFKNGIGNKNEILTIKVPAGNKNCGAYSFIDFNYFDNTNNEDIQVVKLDDFKFTPDLIKIDTQGFEEQVLLGAIKTLQTCDPVIIAEVETKEQKASLTRILDNLGYTFVEKHRRDYIWIKNTASKP
jgi:FkbM family methyltransferase